MILVHSFVTTVKIFNLNFGSSIILLLYNIIYTTQCNICIKSCENCIEYTKYDEVTLIKI